MQQDRRQGFTLIELLTVIAIISILTAFTSVALPRMIEKARLTKLDGVFHSIEVAMAEYYVTHSSFPPSYGFIDFNARQAQLKQSDPNAITVPENIYYHLNPYLSYVRLHGVKDVHDIFGESYDVNGDNQINIYEFSPIGMKIDLTIDQPQFPTERYTGTNLPQEVALQLQQDSHPLVYVPVNVSQFKRAQSYWLSKGDFQAKTWDASDPLLKDVRFPPAKYDAYVLISIGPGESLFGVVPEDRTGVSNIPARDMYHVQAMRTYFLATRDMNDNQLLDYDFYARTKEGEGALTYTYKNAPVTNELPTADPNFRNSYGPIIKKYGV